MTAFARPVRGPLGSSGPAPPWNPCAGGWPADPSRPEPPKRTPHASIGSAQATVLAIIEPFVQHERPLIRSAAARALLQLTGDPRWGDLLVELLGHQQLQVRRAALMDLGAAGWRPALEPIAATLAENSLKLIALRGLVENGQGEPNTDAVLASMDALL